MNPLIITIVIALATFILSIFTANWLNQQHVNKLMEKQDEKLKAQLETLATEIKRTSEVTQSELSGVRNEIGHVTQRLDRIERQLDQIFKPSLP